MGWPLPRFKAVETGAAVGPIFALIPWTQCLSASSSWGAVGLVPNGCSGSHRAADPQKAQGMAPVLLPVLEHLPPMSHVWALLTATATGVTRASNGGSRPLISRFMS